MEEIPYGSLEWPLPPRDLRAVHAVFVGVVDAVDNLRFQPLFSVGCRRLQSRNAIDHVNSLVEPVHLIEDGEFKRSIDVSLLLIILCAW